MATTVLRTPTFRPTSSSSHSFTLTNANNKFLCVSFPHRRNTQTPFTGRCRIYHPSPIPNPSSKLPRRLLKFLPFASNDGGAETATQADPTDIDPAQESLELEENSDGSVGAEGADSESDVTDAEEPASIIISSLQLYRDALLSNDEAKIAEIESFFISIEDEKNNLQQKFTTLSEELSYEKERVLRISADFDNFRKRTERERLSLVTNAQGEVVETLLPVLDNFERAKSQIKVENEGEEKINNSYQSIYKQFAEILGSLGVVPVETVGKPFDPMLHEAIMREDSTELEEGVIIDEYRKGFKLGDRLLRPSMVKVSAGPGPAKPETVEPSEGSTGQDDGTETSEGASAKSESAED